ncbi:MAG: hypothetical protein VYD25_02260 [Pseudomonadota bacterium]|nr:hypothetical protein [Pseudomonadales bacterium]MED5406542.1 hypothetical protein [Pseudomonadota bacterium]
MLDYLRLFIELCLFRQPAANVPRSESLLLITVTTAVLSAAINAIPDEGFGQGLLLSGCQILLFSGIIWVALKIKGVPERWLQTLTGIFGATTILQLLTLPLFGWQKPLVSAETGQLMLTMPLMIVAAIAIWSLTVMASILRQAMEIRIAGAILLVIFCQAVVLFIISLLIGSPTR